MTYIRLEKSKTNEFGLTSKMIMDHLISKYPKSDIELKFSDELKKDVIHISNTDCSEEDILKEEINGIRFIQFAEITTWKKEAIKDIGGEDAFNQEYDLRFTDASRSLLDEKTIEELNTNKRNYTFTPIEIFDKKLKFDSFFIEI